MLVPTDTAVLFASRLDLTDSLSIREGETWVCQLMHEPSTIECRLLSRQRHPHRLEFDHRADLTCVLIEQSDYRTNTGDPNGVHLIDWTQIKSPREASFALTCIGAGQQTPTAPWRSLYPADENEAGTRNSVWIDIDQTVDLVVHRSTVSDRHDLEVP